MQLSSWRLVVPMMDGNFDCKVDLTLSVLQILYKAMHVLELRVNHCCNVKLLLQDEIHIVSAYMCMSVYWDRRVY